MSCDSLQQKPEICKSQEFQVRSLGKMIVLKTSGYSMTMIELNKLTETLSIATTIILSQILSSDTATL